MLGIVPVRHSVSPHPVQSLPFGRSPRHCCPRTGQPLCRPNERQDLRATRIEAYRRPRFRISSSASGRSPPVAPAVASSRRKGARGPISSPATEGAMHQACWRHWCLGCVTTHDQHHPSNSRLSAGARRSPSDPGSRRLEDQRAPLVCNRRPVHYRTPSSRYPALPTSFRSRSATSLCSKAPKRSGCDSHQDRPQT